VSTNLPPLPLIRADHYCVSGKVTIHPSAAIAPGVLLQADPDSEIVIANGVCIGAGAILHAYRGMLEIEAGVTLGTGVLIVGSGQIGKNACVGANTLIWNCSLAADQVVAAGSRMGEVEEEVDHQVNQPQVSPSDSSDSFATDSSISPSPGYLGGAIVPIYGKAAVNQLITALFPHRQMNGSPPPQSSDPVQPE
jgi:carbon dioxide concentrating mechanism protein CcmN